VHSRLQYITDVPDIGNIKAHKYFYVDLQPGVKFNVVVVVVLLLVSIFPIFVQNLTKFHEFNTQS
jgi:hypothetical protein